MPNPHEQPGPCFSVGILPAPESHPIPLGTQSDLQGNNVSWEERSSFKVGPSSVDQGLMQLVQSPAALYSRRNLLSGAPAGMALK